MSGAPLSIGLVGVGKHGERYLQHIRSDFAGSLRLVAICRRDEAAGRAQAAEVGCRFHRDLLELVADPAVEAVIAVVPPNQHTALIEATVAARKPLLIEKPFARTGEEAERLRALVEAAGIPCLVAHTLRFSPVVRALRERRNAIGAVSQIALGQSFEPSRLAWLDDPEHSGGGSILHTGVHQFDLVRYLTDAEVAWVSCFTARVVTQRTEDSFSASMLLAPRDGGPAPLASVSASRATASRYGEMRLIGANGQLVADHVHRSLTLIQERRVVESIDFADVPTVREVLTHFVDVATGRRSPLVTAADGAAAVQIADACYRSARDGCRAAVAGR